eukprot:gene3738-4146_t
MPEPSPMVQASSPQHPHFGDQSLSQHLFAGCAPVPVDVPAPPQLTLHGGAYLGIKFAPQDPVRPDRLVVESVNPGSPAARAGLQPGDVLSGVTGRPLPSHTVAKELLSSCKVGLKTMLTVLRGGADIPLQVPVVPTVRPAAQPAASQFRATVHPGEPNANGRHSHDPGAASLGAPTATTGSASGLKVHPYLGIKFAPADPAWPGALLVDAVNPGSPAARAGLRQGDMLVGIDGQGVGSKEQAQDVFASRRVGGAAVISVVRQGNRFDLTVLVESKPSHTPRHASWTAAGTGLASPGADTASGPVPMSAGASEPTPTTMSGQDVQGSRPDAPIPLDGETGPASQASGPAAWAQYQVGAPVAVQPSAQMAAAGQSDRIVGIPDLHPADPAPSVVDTSLLTHGPTPGSGMDLHTKALAAHVRGVTFMGNEGPHGGHSFASPAPDQPPHLAPWDAPDPPAPPEQPALPAPSLPAPWVGDHTPNPSAPHQH